jgi:hypothetical protein
MEPWIYDTSKSWGVHTWGLWAKPAKEAFLHIHDHANYLNCAEWHFPIPETLFGPNMRLNKILYLTTAKDFDTGHIKRINFVHDFQRLYPDMIYVHGRANYHQHKNYQGVLENDCKSSVIPTYKYILSFENNSEHNYATEKLWEPILCETLCFYWGCPNLETWIDPRAFVRLSDNFETACNTIMCAINEDWHQRHLDVIRREKAKIIAEYGFMPIISKVIG